MTMHQMTGWLHTDLDTQLRVLFGLYDRSYDRNFEEAEKTVRDIVATIAPLVSDLVEDRTQSKIVVNLLLGRVARRQTRVADGSQKVLWDISAAVELANNHQELRHLAEERRSKAVCESVPALEVECQSCAGTGVFRGLMEGEGVGVLCRTCNGSGKEMIDRRLFNGRRFRSDVHIVKVSILAGAESGPVGQGVKYEEFLEGKMPAAPAG